ncbi:MAG: hypothetical protein RIT81_28520 [Deltaproteobacteria bacterium]
MHRYVFAAALIALTACSGGEDGADSGPGTASDGGPRDAGSPRDAGPTDGGAPHDAGTRDAGTVRDGGPRDGGPMRDGGPRDAGVMRDGGPRDAGVMRDGGPRDSGVMRDGGPRDAGVMRDGGAPDSGTPDSGMPPDAGTPDAGPNGGGVAACLGVSSPARIDRGPDGQTYPFGPATFIALSGNGQRVATWQGADELGVWHDLAPFHNMLPFVSVRDLASGEQYALPNGGTAGAFTTSGDLYFHPMGNGVAAFDWATHSSTMRVGGFNASITAFDVDDAGVRVVFETTASNVVPMGTGIADVYVHEGSTITRVSEAPNGAPGNGASGAAKISGNGRYVVFRSVANNLVAGDTNVVEDVFRYDLMTGALVRVSVDATGNEANGHAVGVLFVTADGNEVFFRSEASNLVPNDNDGAANYFVKNMTTGAVERLPQQQLVRAIEPTGRYLVVDDFTFSTLEDRVAQTNTLLHHSPYAASAVAFSDDASLVAYDVRFFEVGVFGRANPLAWSPSVTSCGGPLPAGPAGWRFKNAYSLPTVAYDVSVTAAGTNGFVWWGDDGVGINATYLVYDDVTRQFANVNIPGAQQLGANHSAVWTGDRLLLFGGRIPSSGIVQDDAFVVDPTFLTFTAAATVGRPSARDRHGAVWTGLHMIVWGGLSGTAALADGARYDPVLDQWSPVSTVGAPAARSDHIQVWTGSEMIVWGGSAGASGGRYDPVTDTWSAMATAQSVTAPTGAWTGTHLVVWDGTAGARYDPVTNAWAPISAVNAPVGVDPVHVLADGYVVVLVDTAAGAYDPTTDTWIPISVAPYDTVGHDVFGPPKAVDLGTDIWIVGPTRTARLGPVLP